MLGNALSISAWHGTTQENAGEIKKNGFTWNAVDLRGSNFRNPNDLGGGVYFYIDSVYGKGRDLAYKYAHQYRDDVAKKQRCSIEIIEAEISMENDRLLDLDDIETKLLYTEFSKKHEIERQRAIYRLKNDGAKRRKNYDGIMVELFIQHINKQNPSGSVQAVQKETFTNFDGCISNFDNGVELCVRDTSCINLKDKGRVSDGNEFKKFL